MQRIRPERLWFWAGGVIAAIFCVPLVAQLLPDRPMVPWAPVPQWRFWFVYLLPPVRALDFVLGILMARIVLAGRWIPLRLGWATALVAVGYAIMLNVPSLVAMDAAMAIPLALLIPAAAVADAHGHDSPLATRTMVWLGEVSFAFYLVHEVLIRYGHLALGPGRTWEIPQAIALIAGFFTTSLLASWLLYAAVERPVMRRWANPRHWREIPPQPPAPAPAPVTVPTTADADQRG